MADTRVLQTSRRRGLIRIAWAVLLLCVVAGSLASRGSGLKHALDELNPSDKLWHVLAYFLLALLPALHERRVTVAVQTVAALFVGVLLEFAQGRFSDRPFDAGDIVANAVGVLIALVAAVWLRPKLTWAPQRREA